MELNKETITQLQTLVESVSTIITEATKESDSLVRFKVRQKNNDPIEKKLINLGVEGRELQGWDTGIGVFKEEWDMSKMKEVKKEFEEMGFEVELDESEFMFVHNKAK